MTSSLVGSEMCIRDRLMTIDYVRSQENPAYALTKGLTAAVHRKAKLLLCCLLYTSDAADDM
eukprot:9746231-Prorocentrum_lima.AAC.1